jgi:hypothetical protein
MIVITQVDVDKNQTVSSDLSEPTISAAVPPPAPRKFLAEKAERFERHQLQVFGTW